MTVSFKSETFGFSAGKYVTGDLLNLVEAKDAKKIKNALSRIKTNGGFNKKFNLYYFKGKKFTDYIDKCPEIITENALVLLPEKSVKTGRLTNCKRFTAKSNFSVTYIEDKLGSALYFKYPDDPSPFMMLVNDMEA